MSHHCDEEPATVADLIFALQQLDPELPVYETWDEVPGWIDVAPYGKSDVLWIGTRKCGRGLPDGYCRNRL